MPTVTLFYRNDALESEINATLTPLRTHIAEQLTCEDIRLRPDEVTIRPEIIEEGNGMIADVELDISAAPFADRVSRQDDICLQIRAFTKAHLHSAQDIRVWLHLHELGHSFE